MKAEQHILDYLHQHKQGKSISDISKTTGHTRATAAKYLEMLKIQNKVDYHTIGKAKIWVATDEKKKIVIAEDQAPIRRLISVILSKDYEVIEAEDGQQALELVSEHMPSLVLLDVMMPKVDGFEVCAQLKKNALTRKIPVIMLTAKREMTDKTIGITSGADDYLTKPFEPRELRERVSAHLTSNQERNPVTQLALVTSVASTFSDLSCYKLKWNHLDDYTKQYGYSKLSEMLKLTAQIITHHIEKTGSQSIVAQDEHHNFYLGVDQSSQHVLKEIEDEFSSTIPFFYDADYEFADKKYRVIKLTLANGKILSIPLVSLSSTKVQQITEENVQQLVEG